MTKVHSNVKSLLIPPKTIVGHDLSLGQPGSYFGWQTKLKNNFEKKTKILSDDMVSWKAIFLKKWKNTIFTKICISFHRKCDNNLPVANYKCFYNGFRIIYQLNCQTSTHWILRYKKEKINKLHESLQIKYIKLGLQHQKLNQNLWLKSIWRVFTLTKTWIKMFDQRQFQVYTNNNLDQNCWSKSLWKAFNKIITNLDQNHSEGCLY